MQGISADPNQVDRTRQALQYLFGRSKELSKWYGPWHYATALLLDANAGTWKNVFTVIYPGRCGENSRQPEKWEYGGLQLTRGSLSFEQAQEFLWKLGSDQIFALPGIPDTPMIAYLYPENPPIRFGSHSPLLPEGYPFERYAFSVIDGYTARAPYGLVYSPKLPLYPSASEAIRSFCKLEHTGEAEFSGQLNVLLPDYRARIRNVTLSSSRVKIECDWNDIEPSALIGKIHFDGPGGKRHNDFRLEPKGTELDVPGFPHRLTVALLSTTGDLIDVSEYFAGGPFLPPGIEIETTAADLEQIVLAGESETLEFKQELPKERERLAISVGAMANRKGGRILVGVDKEATIVGYAGEKPEETIRNILRQYCDPPIEPKVDIVHWRDKQVVVITVREGTDKPYSVKEKGFYIRIGSTNRIMTRYELDEMYRQKIRPLTHKSF